MSLCFRGAAGALEMGEAPARLRMSLGFSYKCGQNLSVNWYQPGEQMACAILLSQAIRRVPFAKMNVLRTAYRFLGGPIC